MLCHPISPQVHWWNGKMFVISKHHLCSEGVWARWPLNSFQAIWFYSMILWLFDIVYSNEWKLQSPPHRKESNLVSAFLAWPWGVKKQVIQQLKAMIVTIWLGHLAIIIVGVWNLDSYFLNFISRQYQQLRTVWCCYVELPNMLQ